LIGWEYSSQKTKCIDATTAKEWDKLLGRPAYHDKVNSLERIVQQRLKEEVDEKEKGLYVEAPVVTRTEIRAVLDLQPLDASF
jgi:hypothetical protein